MHNAQYDTWNSDGVGARATVPFPEPERQEKGAPVVRQ